MPALYQDDYDVWKAPSSLHRIEIFPADQMLANAMAHIQEVWLCRTEAETTTSRSSTNGKTRWLKHRGASCAQHLLGTRNGCCTSWTRSQRQDRENHQQNLQSQTVTQPDPHHDKSSTHDRWPPGPSFSLLVEPRLWPSLLSSALFPVATAKRLRNKASKNHVEMHTTGLLEGQVPEQGLTDSSLHICPVCSHLISTRTRPCCPRCHPALGNRVSQLME